MEGHLRGIKTGEMEKKYSVSYEIGSPHISATCKRLLIYSASRGSKRSLQMSLINCSTFGSFILVGGGYARLAGITAGLPMETCRVLLGLYFLTGLEGVFGGGSSLSNATLTSSCPCPGVRAMASWRLSYSNFSPKPKYVGKYLQDLEE